MGFTNLKKSQQYNKLNILHDLKNIATIYQYK